MDKKELEEQLKVLIPFSEETIRAAAKFSESRRQEGVRDYTANPYPFTAEEREALIKEHSTLRNKSLSQLYTKMIKIDDVELMDTTPNKQEQQLERFARGEKCWYGDEQSLDMRNFIGCGCEARVYESKDLTKVLKVVNYTMTCCSPKEFIDLRITMFNLLYPETAYELVGFSRYYGDFCFVLEQPFIEGTRMELSEIEREMNKRGFMNDRYQFVNDNCIVEDLHQGNVLKDKYGNVFVIDAIPSLVSSKNKTVNESVNHNDYYIQQRQEMQKSTHEMTLKPLSLEEKREQTDLILNRLYY